MKLLALIILTVILTYGCNKYDVAPGTPSCLKETIKNYDDGSCDQTKMDEYEFQNKLVYLFDDGCDARDGGSPVFDSDCNEIGFLGGFTGNTKINGEEFSSAVYKRTVWIKN